MKRKKKIALLTAGGDCPGLNAALRGVGKAAILEYGMEVIGIRDGFSGLINMDFLQLNEEKLSGILTKGGTILGTSREKPFKESKYHDFIKSKPEIIQENYDKLGLDCIVCLGGNGTQKTADKLSALGLNVIGLPKTIDNDVWATDLSFGFDSALNIATEAIDRIHTTANSHRRIMVVEIMGHNAGWLTLYSGIAGGGDLILIPEIPYNEKTIISYLEDRAEKGKPYSIVVVAEGIKKPENKKAATYIAELINKTSDLEARETILGYIQRGGSPSPADRVLATRLGAAAAESISDGHFGIMVAIQNNNTVRVPLKDVAGKLKTVPSDMLLLERARQIGTSFGDC
ncbi:MAG: 6-phosphofructokinase [Spirochaetes bacterium]|nr:6-phosphofructokinase [Spirochaetota bacterium]